VIRIARSIPLRRSNPGIQKRALTFLIQTAEEFTFVLEVDHCRVLFKAARLFTFYIMGNFFSSTIQGHSAPSLIITSNTSGILSAVVATRAFSSLLVDYSVQTREALSPTTLEISKSLPGNPSQINKSSKCTADCNAIRTVDNLRRQNDRAKDVSKKSIEVGRVVDSKQTDLDLANTEHTRGTKTDSKALLIHQNIGTRPIE
jgi:hypothetical protein